MVKVCERECIGRCPGNEPLTLTRCHSCELQKLYEAFEGGSPSMTKLTTLGHEGEILSFSFTYLLFSLISGHDAC